MKTVENILSLSLSLSLSLFSLEDNKNDRLSVFSVMSVIFVGPIFRFSVSKKQKMSLPTENPFPNRNILANLRFERSWKDIVIPEMRDAYEVTKRAQRAIVHQLVIVAMNVRKMYEIKKRPFHVALIGCGQIGQLLILKLLEEGIRSENIFVSTRQPELLSKFEPMGVRCTNDNEMVCKRASVVFMLCGQHHIKLISAELRGLVRQNAVLVSSLADVTREKLRAVFSTVPEQTLRSRIDVVRMPKKGSDLEVACSELCTNKATGLREIYGAMVSLGKKLGIPEVEKIARTFLFGHGSFVYYDEKDQFQQFLQSKDALSALLTRCESGFSEEDETCVLPVGVVKK